MYLIDGRSYAYSTLNLEEKEIQELGELLKPFVHLSNINLSKNDLRDISCISELPNLLTFSCSGAAVSSLDFMANNPESLKYLQVRNFQNNNSVTVVARPICQQDQRVALPQAATAYKSEPQ
jgi:Leucine-rich repeat (LRR) protein